MLEQQDKKEDMKKPSQEPVIDAAGLNMSGHILIRDKETGEVIINKRNAIHYGNMARVVALALNNTAGAYINYMAFGNGGTSIDTSGGRVIYKSPRVSESYEASTSLYNKTYHKDIQGVEADDLNKIEIITGPSYTDIKMTVTLGYAEPADQDVFDNSTNNAGDYVFDELGVFTYPADATLPTDNAQFNTSTMLTHVIFHPVQKSQNRVIEIIYTIRIQLS